MRSIPKAANLGQLHEALEILKTTASGAVGLCIWILLVYGLFGGTVLMLSSAALALWAAYQVLKSVKDKRQFIAQIIVTVGSIAGAAGILGAATYWLSPPQHHATTHRR